MARLISREIPLILCLALAFGTMAAPANATSDESALPIIESDSQMILKTLDPTKKT